MICVICGTEVDLIEKAIEERWLTHLQGKKHIHQILFASVP